MAIPEMEDPLQSVDQDQQPAAQDQGQEEEGHGADPALGLITYAAHHEGGDEAQ